jgi:hypothetical protein
VVVHPPEGEGLVAGENQVRANVPHYENRDRTCRNY